MYTAPTQKFLKTHPKNIIDLIYDPSRFETTNISWNWGMVEIFFFQNEMKGTRLLERSKGHKLKVKGYNQSPLLRKL